MKKGSNAKEPCTCIKCALSSAKRPFKVLCWNTECQRIETRMVPSSLTTTSSSSPQRIPGYMCAKCTKTHQCCIVCKDAYSKKSMLLANHMIIRKPPSLDRVCVSCVVRGAEFDEKHADLQVRITTVFYASQKGNIPPLRKETGIYEAVGLLPKPLLLLLLCKYL